MAARTISLEKAQQCIDVMEEVLGEGFPLEGAGRSNISARTEAAKRLGINRPTLDNRLWSAEQNYGLKVDPARYAARAAPPPFTFDELPDDGEPDAEELIGLLAARHQKRKAHYDASKLRQVQVNIDGPIAIWGFGDPHVDDKGCAWGDLERDVRICRDTPGVLAVDVGDNSNNWVGRLMRLYAQQEVTPKQSLRLIEWLMCALPWLHWEDGNHDVWNTEKGDPVEIMHKMHKRLGSMQTGGTRLQLNLPAGSSVMMHVRHDFPGGSQFNPAHAMVRETLFGFRDHILMCGHRHHTGYIPVWHNDPKRLCHGFRLGTYKDMDSYADEKGFHDGNWARSMGAIVDPAHASDPVRYVQPFFNIEEMAEVLTWKRGKYDVARAA